MIVLTPAPLFSTSWDLCSRFSDLILSLPIFIRCQWIFIKYTAKQRPRFCIASQESLTYQLFPLNSESSIFIRGVSRVETLLACSGSESGFVPACKADVSYPQLFLRKRHSTWCQFSFVGEIAFSVFLILFVLGILVIIMRKTQLWMEVFTRSCGRERDEKDRYKVEV